MKFLHGKTEEMETKTSSLVLQVRRVEEILESPCPTGPPLERLKVKTDIKTVK